MSRKFIIATVLTALVPALASAEPVKNTFTRDGVTYTYTSEVKGDTTVIKGSAEGRTFRLVSKGRVVYGIVNGSPVSFKMDAANEGTKEVALAD